MAGMENVIELVTGVAGFLRHHAAPQAGWPDATRVAVLAVLAGLALALWGGRLLRALYVLAFMGAGAAVGIHVARTVQTDDLIGLVVGAGLAGLAGHLLYRWWVGITAGFCAVLFVAGVAGARNLPEIQTELRSFDDQRLGVGTGQYLQDSPGVRGDGLGSVRAYLADLGGYCWNRHRDVAFILGLAWLTGLGMGLTLPRFTIVLGTSLLGVLGLALGVGLLVSVHWPGLWRAVLEQAAWALVGLGVVLAASLAYQAWHGQRRHVLPASEPAAA